MKLLANFLFALLFCFSASAQKADDWKLVRNQEGVKIYLRSVEGMGTKQFGDNGWARQTIDQ